MQKTRFTAELINGQLVTRTSTSMAYTHAVVSTKRSVSWHTSRELAERGMAQAVRYYRYDPSELRVVKVQAEEIVRKRTAPADQNAIRRGVISRDIKRWQASLAYNEARLVEWQAGGAERNKERLIRDFGEERAATMQASHDASMYSWVADARKAIERLERERAALLAAKAEG
jgi:hypothetical protein